MSWVVHDIDYRLNRTSYMLGYMELIQLDPAPVTDEQRLGARSELARGFSVGLNIDGGYFVTATAMFVFLIPYSNHRTWLQKFLLCPTTLTSAGLPFS